MVICLFACLYVFSFSALAGQAQSDADSSQNAQEESEFLKKLKALPGVVEVNPSRGRGGDSTESYAFMFEQPLDHNDPDGATFHQRVFIAHRGYDKPVLLGTAGYAARGVSGGELQRMLNGNQVTVEHRYFGSSKPSPVDWKYLTVENSAHDLHAVVTALKKIYTGKWVSTGSSKGGQTALFYKCYFPDDMDAVVAYVAPLNIAQEDPRVHQYIKTAGDAETRDKIKQFQIAMLKRQDELLPLIKEQSSRMRFDRAGGLPAAFEYSILEYPYAFWQYGTSADSIPAPDASAEEMLNHYNRVRTLYYYSDGGISQFEAFQYQAFTEIGYYNYDITELKAYLKTLKNPSNLVLCPEGAEITYDARTMAFVYDFLLYKADHVVYIYGGEDTWTASQIPLLGRTDALKFVNEGKHHGTGVRDFTSDEREQFYAAMERWLGFELNK